VVEELKSVLESFVESRHSFDELEILGKPTASVTISESSDDETVQG